jgi:predicted lactoylglutathione lyase
MLFSGVILLLLLERRFWIRHKVAYSRERKKHEVLYCVSLHVYFRVYHFTPTVTMKGAKA